MGFDPGRLARRIADDHRARRTQDRRVPRKVQGEAGPAGADGEDADVGSLVASVSWGNAATASDSASIASTAGTALTPLSGESPLGAAYLVEMEVEVEVDTPPTEAVVAEVFVNGRRGHVTIPAGASSSATTITIARNGSGLTTVQVFADWIGTGGGTATVTADATATPLQSSISEA